MTEEEINDFLENDLTRGEREAIDVALETEKPWSHKQFDDPIKSNLEAVKNKIKGFHFAKVDNKCCYCRRSLRDATMEADREHIVPKRKVKSLSYNIFNISIACKRCNMTYKGQKTDHIVDFASIDEDFRNADRYLIPHPNIDRYEDHLFRRVYQHGNRQFTTYDRFTDKGKFLFKFVELNRLCVNEFDIAQGGDTVSEFIAKLASLPLEGS